MTEKQQLDRTLSMAEQALADLRAYAKGNGIEETSFELIETEEDVYTVQALLSLEPFFETTTQQYEGEGKNSKTQFFPSAKELRQEITKAKSDLISKRNWIKEATQEIKSTLFYGWGINEGKIPLSTCDKYFGTTQNCPTCNGLGATPCVECQGLGKKQCHHCLGSGEETCLACNGLGHSQTTPNQPCSECNGTGKKPCSFCFGTKEMTCPFCSGSGKKPCETCQSTGKITEEITMAAFASIKFRLTQDKPLPSGFLRSLERIGHRKSAAEAYKISFNPHKDENGAEDKTSFDLSANIPYAAIKMRIGKKAYLISSFGKNRVLNDVPLFLDSKFKQGLLLLQKVKEGKRKLEEVQHIRAFQEALYLTLKGKRKKDYLLKRYPVGLSEACARKIMKDTFKALQRSTLKTRFVTGLSCFLMGTSLLALLFWDQTQLKLLNIMPPIASQLGGSAITLITAFLILKGSTERSLKKRFRFVKTKHSKIGKMGWSILALLTVVVAFLLFHGPFKI